MLLNATNKVKTMHARRNPNLSLSSAQYSQLSPSVTSATFLSPTVASRRGLLSPSPPPSPNLPSLVPRHGKKQPSSGHWTLIRRVLIGACLLAVLLWVILHQVYIHDQEASDYEDDGEEWEMVGGNLLPEEPMAVALQDAKGNSKWTVSIPDSFEFPLNPGHYRNICTQSMELSKQVREEAKAASGIAKRMLSYYHEDEYYIDVQEAEEQALLPPSTNSERPKGFVDDEAIANKESTEGLPVCDRTMTYVMETGDAGFGNTLLRLWMSYGLAQAENRTFFVDDTRWPYGKYSNYFMPPPSAGCRPPPQSHMVPCPHTARHLIISSATVKSAFGHAFTEEWEDPRKMRVQRQHKIFGLLRAGYENLFKLREDDAKYVVERTKQLYEPITQDGGISIGIHVRRGDKHPMEFQYQKDYIPLGRYMDKARDIYIDRIENANSPSKKERGLNDNLFARHTASKLVVATDDPEVYESNELGPNSIRAQERIVLATKATLESAQGKKNPWIDEITGWEGGFYRDVFFSLGQPVSNADDMSKLNSGEVPEGAMGLRELVGRAYLLDLAVVGQADTMVCTVSSIGCRILAVMMGWDSAIEQGNWMNIDGQFEWKGIIW